MRTIKTTISVVIVSLLILAMIYPAVFAKSKKKTKEPVSTIPVTTVVMENSLRGEVGFISDEYISVIYATNPERGSVSEAVVYIGDNMNIVHKEFLAQIQPGDIVSIAYDETTDMFEEEGELKEHKKRIAKEVKFIRPKKEGLISGN